MLDALLREAFDELPEGVTALLLSWLDPPAVFARQLANGHIARIAAERLRFTREESDRLVDARIAADDAAKLALHERSAGWAAGLVLMIEHHRHAGVPAQAPGDDAPQTVFDYFAGEIFARCNADEQRLLLLTAPLPVLTVPLAEAASMQADAGCLLERLHRHHLFVERQAGPVAGYRIHGLYRAFLQAQGVATLPAAERSAAARRAAQRAERDGEADDAVALHLAAGEAEAAARLIVAHARRWAGQGRWRMLLGWIDALPAAQREAEPWLGYWAGAGRLWTDPARARVALERAFDGFARNDDAAGQVLAACALSRAGLLDPDWRGLDRWIDALEALLAGDRPNLGAALRLAGCSRLLYAMLARQPRNARLPHWAERTAALLGTATEPDDAVLAGFSLLFYFTWTGQTARGEDVVRQIEPLAADARVGTVARAYWSWARANHLLRAGGPTEALATIGHALGLAEGDGLAVGAVIRRHRIAHLLTAGDTSAAQAELDTLAAAPRIEPYFELRAWLALAQDRPAEALEDARAALAQAVQRGRRFYELLDLALLAVVEARLGGFAAARLHLQALREATQGMPGEHAALEAAWIEAWIAHREGDAPACHRALHDALAIGGRQRCRSAWGWHAAMMQPLLAEALRLGIGVAEARELIRTHRWPPPACDVPGWPWPVRIRTLGRFAIELDDVPLRFAGKAQRKPLELLKLLVAGGEAPQPVETLIDRLWPQPETGGRKAFDITVHRLRRLLGHDAAVAVADQRAGLDPAIVWVDAWVLERLLAAGGEEGDADGADGADDAGRLEGVAQRVLELLGGPFLAGDAESPALLARRQRLGSRFQRFAERLGSCREREGQWRRADELYQRASHRRRRPGSARNAERAAQGDGRQRAAAELPAGTGAGRLSLRPAAARR